MSSMIAPSGTYRNPALKACFGVCTACGRCRYKGTMAACYGCSGRLDPEGKRVPDVDDYCRCPEGILQIKTKEGRFIQIKYPHNPYRRTVLKQGGVTRDEADWNQYLNETREKLDNPDYDPIQFSDGSSTDTWMKKKWGKDV